MERVIKWIYVQIQFWSLNKAKCFDSESCTNKSDIHSKNGRHMGGLIEVCNRKEYNYYLVRALL